MRTLSTVLVICLVVAIGVTVGGTTAYAEPENGTDQDMQEKMTSAFGIEYSISYSTDDHTLTIEATNPTNSSQPAGVSVSTDDRTIFTNDFRLKSGGHWSKAIDTRSALNALRDTHSVTVSSYGVVESFAYEYAIDAQNSTVVPTPYISNTTVTTGEIDGSSSTVVEVAVVNPSDQFYPTKLMVHTTATDGSFYAAIVPPGESETVTVELLDDVDSTVVGEARLYANDINDSSGGIDQIGFEGRVDGNTSAWNESYSAIEGPWSEDAYQYQNSSVDRPSVAEQVSGGEEVRGVPVVFPAVGLVGALVALFFVRRR